MSPVTWEQHTPTPELDVEIDTEQRTEQTPDFELSDFGDDTHERTTIAVAAYDFRPKFTGRDNLITQLHKLLGSAFATPPQLAFVTVVGEPGMGKSRIIGELLARVTAEHPDLLVLAGTADDHAHAYGPIARALTSYFGLVGGEDPTTSRERIQEVVAKIVPAPRALEIVHLVAHLLRVPFDDSPITAPLLDSPARFEARLFMALKRLLAAASQHRPLVVFVENLELCENDTIHFLQYLATGLRDHQVAIIGTATPLVHTRHSTFGDGEVAPVEIALGSLSPTESEDLLRELCKQLSDVPPQLIAHTRSLGGSPRAIHELVRLLFESQVIVREGLMWRIDSERLAKASLPKSYEDLVAARLRVMDATERRIIEMASVVGETCWLDAVIALERGAHAPSDPDGPTLAQIAASSDQSRTTVVTSIDKLVNLEWLVDVEQSSVPGERELRFAYPNLWQLVYQGIDESKRRGYHAIVARWLELHSEGRSPAAQEEVGRHLALAGDAREAATRYRRAAAAARAQYQNEKAIRLFDRALACIGDQDSAARIHLWHDLGSVYELIGDLEAALGAFERTLRLSWLSASKTKAAVAFNKMGRVWRRKGDLKLALEYLERGLELFRAAADARGVAGSLDDIGKTLHMLGRYDEAFEKISEALARRSKGGDKRAIATSMSRLGDVQQDRGQYDAAYQCHQEALTLREQAGDRWGQIVSRNNLAALAFEHGDTAEARASWVAALAEAESIGALPLAALVLTNLGESALADGKLDEAKTRLDNALEIINDVEDRGLQSECYRHLATLERLHSRTQSARELAERALQIARSAGLREKEGLAYLTLGEVLSTSIYDADEAGAPSDAAVAYAKAIEVLGAIHNDAALARALAAFGRYQAETGAITQARDTLRSAIAMFARLGLGKQAHGAEQLIASLA